MMNRWPISEVCAKKYSKRWCLLNVNMTPKAGLHDAQGTCKFSTDPLRKSSTVLTIIIVQVTTNKSIKAPGQ